MNVDYFLLLYLLWLGLIADSRELSTEEIGGVDALKPQPASLLGRPDVVYKPENKYDNILSEKTPIYIKLDNLLLKIDKIYLPESFYINVKAIDSDYVADYLEDVDLDEQNEDHRFIMIEKLGITKHLATDLLNIVEELLHEKYIKSMFGVVSTSVSHLYEESKLPQWSTWSEWSMCDAMCGEGLRFRTRYCITTEQYKCEGEETRSSEQCHDTVLCGATGGEPSTASVSETNKGTTQEQRSTISEITTKNPTATTSTVTPHEPDTPSVNPLYTWAPWSACSVSCGEGLQTRSHQVPYRETEEFLKLGEFAPMETQTRTCIKENCTNAINLDCSRENVGTKLIMQFAQTPKDIHGERRYNVTDGYVYVISQIKENDKKNFYCTVVDQLGNIIKNDHYYVVFCNNDLCSGRGTCLQLEEDPEHQDVVSTCQCDEGYTGRYCLNNATSFESHWKLMVIVLSVILALIFALMLCSINDCGGTNKQYDYVPIKTNKMDRRNMTAVHMHPCTCNKDGDGVWLNLTAGLPPGSQSNVCSHNSNCPRYSQININNNSNETDSKGGGLCCGCFGKGKEYSEEPSRPTTRNERLRSSRQLTDVKVQPPVEKPPAEYGTTEKKRSGKLHKTSSSQVADTQGGGDVYLNQDYVTFIGRDKSDFSKNTADDNKNLNANGLSSIASVVIYSSVFGKMMGASRSEQDMYTHSGKQKRRDHSSNSYATTVVYSDKLNKLMKRSSDDMPAKPYASTVVYSDKFDKLMKKSSDELPTTHTTQHYNQNYPTAVRSNQSNNNKFPLPPWHSTRPYQPMTLGLEKELNVNSNCFAGSGGLINRNPNVYGANQQTFQKPGVHDVCGPGIENAALQKHIF